MSIWSNLEDLGESILESAGDFIGSAGDKAEAQGNLELANANRVQVNSAIALQKFNLEQEVARKNQELTKTVILSLVLLIVVFAGFKMYQQYAKSM